MNEKTMKFEYGGKFTSRGEWIHPERSIETYEWIVMTEGEAQIEEDGKQYDLQKGSVLLLEPGKLHRGTKLSQKRVSFYWIHFRAEDAFKAEKCFSLCDPYEVSLLCRQLLHYSQKQYPADAADALLAVLFYELKRQGGGGAAATGALATRVREWIRINVDRSLEVGDVAAHFGYHADYLSRVFQQAFGHGLKAEIDACRMRRIKHLLLESDLTLYEIADRVGMTDYKLFLKFFKYHEGMTPSEFRALYPYFHTNNR